MSDDSDWGSVISSEWLAQNFQNDELLSLTKEVLARHSLLIAAPKLLSISKSCPNVILVDDTYQVVGAFKIRGAVASVDAAASLGIDSLNVASSGSFGMSVAFIASKRGLHTNVFMPADSPRVKKEKIQEFGANIDDSAGSYEEAKKLARNSDGFFLDGVSREVFAGNGSLVLQCIEQIADKLVEPVAAIVPLGIGSLALPTTKILTELGIRHDLHVVEPSAYAKFASLRDAGIQPSWSETVADGAAVRRLPDGFGNLLDSLVTWNFVIPDELVLSGMRDLWAKWGVLSEGAGALAYAAFRANISAFSEYGTVLVFVTGSNIDDRLRQSGLFPAISSVGQE